MSRRFSSTEALLNTLVLVLFAVCVGLIVVAWLALQPATNEDHPEETTMLSGTLVISKGAEFTEELLDKSSMQFKALAFDTEQQIAAAFQRSSLDNQFKKCYVQAFRNGSVVVNFDLSFRGTVGSKEAQEELVARIQGGDDASQGLLVFDPDSVHISTMEDPTTTWMPTTARPVTITTAVVCPTGMMACGDGKTCIPKTQLCDGLPHCPDGSDETERLCATVCDGQFLLPGPIGSFHSESFPLEYKNDTVCRWVIRVERGLAIRIDFISFHTEEHSDILDLYEGVGTEKILTYSLSGSSPPGSVWLFSHDATVEFYTDFINNLQGFNATYQAKDISLLSNEEKINCSFEESLCFWRQDFKDDGDWIRIRGPSFPPFTGPSFDHTLGNQSGFYIVTPGQPGSWEKIFRIYSLPLVSLNESMCIRFWYHMYGDDVRRLRVLAQQGTHLTILFQKEGNYGDQWNYGQVTLNSTKGDVVVFEAQKMGGFRNDIALDDISMTPGPCGAGPPDPTPVPPPTTPPPIPPDCGGPFDLWEPNSTFSSPNYPGGYGGGLSCLWILHAQEGRNIQLHFLDFNLEATYDLLEVRDGAGPASEFLGVLTGERNFPDLFSTTNQMTVLLYTDSSGNGRGFHANFTTGVSLGQPEPCPPWQYQCHSGECVSNHTVCDGVMDCPDASDEGDCVHLMSVNGTEDTRLKLQVQTTIYTPCAQNWTHQLSNVFCSYLGYRAGNASFVTILEGDHPFTHVSLTSNGTVDLKPSEQCPGDKVISLLCDNQPCGRRKVHLEAKVKVKTNVENVEREKLDEESDGRVVGGADAQVGAWPWAVSLQWRGRHVCGASLIDKQWLVTAAHCVFGKNVPLSNWAAYLGLHSQYGTEFPNRQVHQVDRIIINKRYNRRTKDSDIALMRLRTTVNFTDYIQPICLPHPGQPIEMGQRCVIAGWGRGEEQGPTEDVLQQAVVPLVNSTQCQAWLPEYNITARMVCAGYPEGGVDSCQGDSGGPLMCEQEDYWMLAGVTSFGVGCGRPQRPGVYALVSQFTSWVVETRRVYALHQSDAEPSVY